MDNACIIEMLVPGIASISAEIQGRTPVDHQITSSVICTIGVPTLSKWVIGVASGHRPSVITRRDQAANMILMPILHFHQRRGNQIGRRRLSTPQRWQSARADQDAHALPRCTEKMPIADRATWPGLAFKVCRVPLPRHARARIHGHLSREPTSLAVRVCALRHQRARQREHSHVPPQSILLVPFIYVSCNQTERAPDIEARDFNFAEGRTF